MNELILLCDIIIILIRNVWPLFFAAGVLLVFGFWFTSLFVVPAIRIHKEIKSGKPFWQVLSEISKNEGYYKPHAIHIANETPYKYDALRDTVGNPAYNNIPGNISYRR